MNAASGRFVLGVLVGVLFGALGMFLIGEGASPPASSTPALERGLSSEVQQPASQSPSDLAAAPASSERAMAKPVEAGARAVEVSDAEVERLLATTDVEPVAAVGGSGVISGVVLDADGLGVAGATVRASRRSTRDQTLAADTLMGGLPEERSVEDAVRSAVSSHASRRSGRFDVITDAQGAYQFTGMSDDRWSLSAHKRGFRVQRAESGGYVRIGQEVDFDAIEVIELPVRVFAESGAPLPSAVIHCKGSERSDQWSFKWSADEPRVWLPAGSYDVTAFSSDSNGDRDADENEASEDSESQSVMLETGVAHEELNFTLRPRRGIKGVVLLPTDGVSGIRPRVHLMTLVPGAEPDLEALASSRDHGGSQSGTEFQFLDLDVGSYVVGVSRSRRTPIVAHQVVELAAGVIECELRVPEIDRSKMIVATVTGPNGSVLSGVDFDFTHKSPNGSRSGGTQSLRDRNQAYLIEIPKDSVEDWDTGGEGASFELTAEHDDYGSQSVDLVAGQSEVSFAFSMPANLRLTVAGYAGSEYIGRVTVNCRLAGEEQRGFFGRGGGGRESLSAEGTTEFKRLAPGSYEVVLGLNSAGGNDWGPQTEIAKAEIELRAGENSLNMAIPALHGFRVHYADAKAGSRIGLSSVENDGNMFRMSNRAEFDKDSNASFDGIAAGDYVLTIWGGSTKKMKISVPCSDLEFEPMELDCLLVTISDDDGDLAKAGFRAGDLVIGIDGVEFDGEPQNRWSELQSSNSAQLSYMVLRGSELIEISVEAGNVGNWSTMGGSFAATQR